MSLITWSFVWSIGGLGPANEHLEVYFPVTDCDVISSEVNIFLNKISMAGWHDSTCSMLSFSSFNVNPLYLIGSDISEQFVVSFPALLEEGRFSSSFSTRLFNLFTWSFSSLISESVSRDLFPMLQYTNTEQLWKRKMTFVQNINYAKFKKFSSNNKKVGFQMSKQQFLLFFFFFTKLCQPDG